MIESKEQGLKTIPPVTLYACDFSFYPLFAIKKAWL